MSKHPYVHLFVINFLLSVIKNDFRFRISRKNAEMFPWHYMNSDVHQMFVIFSVKRRLFRENQ